MERNVTAAPSLSNGDLPPVVATHCMDVLDAAYHTANQYVGGARALAARLQTRDRIDGSYVPMNPSTFTHKVNPRAFTHSLSLEEARDVMVMSGDCRILYALAHATGHVAIRTESDPSGLTIEKVGVMAKEFSDVVAAATAAQGTRISPNEMARVECEAADLIAALNAVVANLRGQMEPR